MKIKTPRKPNPHRRDKLIALKVSAEEFAALTEKAARLAGGNLSAFVRFAALNIKM